MAPFTSPGEPHEAPKPEPIGNIPMIFLFTTCTLCALFLLWRRADALRGVISHRLKNLNGTDGQIRLSEDNGPPNNEFIVDNYDEDNAPLNSMDDEPLSEHIRESTRAWREPDTRVPAVIAPSTNTSS